MQNTWLENRIHKWHYDHLEGGGGMSDLTTAQVTFNVASEVRDLEIQAANIYDDPTNHGTQGLLYINNRDIDEVHTIILYKGSAYMSLTSSSGINITISGNVEDIDGDYVIKGDCKFTITHK